jgi:GNAT superfamily N-acetyltransferase
VSLDVRRAPFDSPTAQALIAAVQREYVERYGGEDVTPVDPDEFAEPHGVFLVAYLNGEAVGCGGWRQHGEDAEIKRMYVVPSARGLGIARTVLAMLESLAEQAGLRRTILETGLAQPEAIGLYTSSGYTGIAGFGVYAAEPNCRCFAKALGARVTG